MLKGPGTCTKTKDGGRLVKPRPMLVRADESAHNSLRPLSHVSFESDWSLWCGPSAVVDSSACSEAWKPYLQG